MEINEDDDVVRCEQCGAELDDCLCVDTGVENFRETNRVGARN